MAVVAATLSRPAEAAGPRPLALGASGRWTLAGTGEPEVPLRREPARVSVPYVLPPHARQGPREWYLIRLHFEITFAAGSGPGLAYVSGLTNGRAAAQIKFQVPSPTSRDRRIVWSSVDLIRGRIERTGSSRTVEVRFRNYLQLAGVRPGENTFTVQLERFGDVEVERLRIFADSGVERTGLAPARLVLEPALPAARVRAGEEFEVGFTLSNRGGRPARNVVVAVQFPSGALAPVGPAMRRAAAVRRELAGSFRFRALRPGRYRLALGVRSSANRPLAVIDVPISGSRARPWWRRVPLLAGALIAGFGLLLLAGGDRRKRAST